MPPRKRSTQVYVANESGTVVLDGVEYPFHAGRTRVREGTPLARWKSFDQFFEPVDAYVHYDDVEQATAAPGEQRGD